MLWRFLICALAAGNVYGALPHTWAMNIFIFLMIIHQICAFIYFNAPMFYLWEKLWGVQKKSLLIRIPSRLPISKSLTAYFILFLQPCIFQLLVVLALLPSLCWKSMQVTEQEYVTIYCLIL